MWADTSPIEYEGVDSLEVPYRYELRANHISPDPYDYNSSGH